VTSGPALNPLRHQLPGFSPLPLSAVIRGARAVLPTARDPRADLLTHLLRSHRVREGRLVDSGTSALRLGLELLAATEKTPVALPAFSCYDVATAAVGAGVPVVLYDIDPLTLGPDLGSLEQALDRGARSAVIAPLYGFPVGWDAIRALVDRHGAVLVEDAAQSHGGEFRGRPPGSWGDMVVFSFGRGKGWTGGGGGALLLGGGTKIEIGDDRKSELGMLARVTAQWLLGRPGLYRLPRSFPPLGLGETRYRGPHAPGEMCRGSAAIALATRSSAEAEVEVRRSAADEYLSELERLDPDASLVKAIPVETDGAGGYLRFPVLAHGPFDNSTVASPLRRLGVERSYPRPLGSLPALREHLVAGQPPHPGAQALASRLVTLPTHSGTRPGERQAALRLLIEAQSVGR
jgi:dTDP-4-amino-4,6-dideoxygalactose transaminase